MSSFKENQTPPLKVDEDLQKALDIARAKRQVPKLDIQIGKWESPEEQQAKLIEKLQKQAEEDKRKILDLTEKLSLAESKTQKFKNRANFEISQFKSEIQNLEESLEFKNQEIRHLQEMLDSKDSEIEEIQRDSKAAEDRRIILDLTEKLSLAESKTREVLDFLIRVDSEISKLQSEIQNLEESQEFKDQEIRHLQEILDSKDTEIEEILKEKTRKEEVSNRKIEFLNNIIQNQNVDDDSESYPEEDVLRKKLETSELLRRQAEEDKRTISDLIEKLSLAESETQEIKIRANSVISKLESQIRNLEESLEFKNQEIRRFQETLDSKESEIKEIQNILGETLRKNEELNQRLSKKIQNEKRNLDFIVRMDNVEKNFDIAKDQFLKETEKLKSEKKEELDKFKNSWYSRFTNFFMNE